MNVRNEDYMIEILQYINKWFKILWISVFSLLFVPLNPSNLQNGFKSPIIPKFVQGINI